MAGLKVLWLLLSIVCVKGSPFFSNVENDLSNFYETETHDHSRHVLEEPDVYRLTDDVVPKSYELRLVPDLEKFTYVGKVDIFVHVKFSTNQIILHSKNLDIKSVRVIKTYLLESTYKLDEANDLLIIETKQTLEYNTDYGITIEFNGVLNDEMRGFYRSSYLIDGKVYWLATTQFEPTYAREAFPCFDEPRFRASFTILVARFGNQLAVSNMPSEAQLPSDSMSGNRMWEKFQQSPPMPTYLLAFMVSEYSYLTDFSGKVHVLARKNALQQVSYALGQSSKALKQLEGFTGVPFKLPKLDVVAIPDFNAGAMENWGMTTYRERYVILDQKTSTEQHKTAVTEVITHEFAHQWFGDLVTPAWWDYLWLNEGFATYFENFAAAKVEPSWNLEHMFVVETMQHALWHEITVQRAITSRVTKFSQIKQAFDVISYDKAGSVIRMFEHIVSPNVFRSALHEYLENGQKNYDGTVTPQILFDAFDKATSHVSTNLPPHYSISDIMKTWTENIGFPLLNISRCYHHGEVTIRQSTYRSARAPKRLSDQKWIVPLTYTTKSELRFENTQPTKWSFADNPLELPERFSNNDWIIFNLQQSGYYRVNYDLRNWRMIIDQLHEDHEKIHVLNRAQLIDDTAALAHDGALNFYIHLHLMSYISKEKDMVVWYSALTSLNRLVSEIEGTPNEIFLYNYLYNVLKTPYETFGFEIKTTDTHVEKIVKPMILSLVCQQGLGDCVQKSIEEYKKYEADLTKIQPDLKRVVYCNALRNSTEAQTVFDNLWNIYTRIDISYDKNLILMSLSCTKDEVVIKKFLKKLIDPKNNEVRKQDVHYITGTFSKQIPTVTAIIKFVIEEIQNMSGTTPSGILSLEKLIGSIQGSIKTLQQLQLIEALKTKSNSLDQTKYSEFISAVNNLHTSATKKIEMRNKMSNRIKEEYLSHGNKPSTDKPQTEKPPQPGSGASALLPKLWWHLATPTIALFYGLPILRTL